MTRINIINPKELFDQHLVAEYREIFMVASSLRRTLNSKQGLDKKKIASKFTLNKGHVYFFYNKGEYLHKRYLELIEEMKRRGMNPDPNRKFPVNDFPINLYNDWEPTQEEQSIVRERIKLRIGQRPGWYRKTSYFKL